MQKLYKRVFHYVYFGTAFLLLFTIPVNAYIDPSVMTYAIQALAGIAIALGTFFGLYWRKIRKPVMRFFNLDETAGKETESDNLFYFDPAVMNKERRIQVFEKEDFQKEKEKGKVRGILEDMIPALFITLSGSFMMCIYAPLDLYFNNKNEFWFNVRILLPQLVRMFCLAVPAVMLVYLAFRLINRKIYAGLLFITTAAFICSYIQGNLRIASLPSMDGTAADWTAYTGENIITLVIWTAIIALLMYIFRYVRFKGFKAVAEVVSCLLFLTCSVSLFTSYINSRNIVEKNVFVASKDHEFDVSDTENFYILVLDAVDADTYKTMTPSHPEYETWFEDFTFFPNTTSLYPFTSRAVPQILTGSVYENERDFTEFVTDAVDNSPFLKSLETDNYRMGLYESELSYNGTKLNRFDNMQTNNVELNPEAKNTFIKEQLKLALFKYLPYCFKKFVSCDMNSFASMMWPQPFLMDNRDFYLDLLNSEVTHMQEKNFRYYHVDGAHSPFRYDTDVNYIPENEGTYTQSIEASMNVAKAFLSKLKEAGVYDQSCIIIMADHGYQADSDSNFDRFNPLLMVKGFNEKHSYAVSEAPISYLDLPEAYSRLLNHSSSEECFDAKEGDERERRLLYLVWQKEDVITEYIQDGYASDYENIKPTGIEFRR